MHDPGGVRLRHRRQRLEHVVDRIGDRELPVQPQELLEIAALQVLHRQERHAIFERPGVHDARDVLALDARGGLRLANEALDDVVALHGVGQEHLQRDHLVERDVARREHDAHAALADHLLDAVLASDHVPRFRARRRAAPLV